jgi:predicted double-glycine peptidase
MTLALLLLLPAAGAGARPPVRDAWQAQVVLQSADITCAPAALANLLRFQMGLEVAEADIVAAMLRGRSLEDIRARGGFSLAEVLEVAEALGLTGRGERLGATDALGGRLPAIVQLDAAGGAHHFVVVLWQEGDRFAVADPASGGRWIGAETLGGMWTGIAFFLGAP